MFSVYTELFHFCFVFNVVCFTKLISFHDLDRPSAPEKPEICDFDEFSTTLSWKKPSSDGGNRILGYQVTQRGVTRTSSWTRKLSLLYLSFIMPILYQLTLGMSNHMYRYTSQFKA